MNPFSAQTLLYQGSKERLHRIIARNNGSITGPNQFQIVMRYKTQRGSFPFRINAVYTPVENGFQIKYTIVPGVWSLVTSLIAIGFIIFGIVIGPVSSHGAVTIFTSLFLGIVLFLSYAYRASCCSSKFDKLFEKKTSSPKHRNS